MRWLQFLTGPGDYGQQVIDFGAVSLDTARAAADTSEVESQHVEIERLKHTGGARQHCVVTRTSIEGVRVAQYCQPCVFRSAAAEFRIEGATGSGDR